MPGELIGFVVERIADLVVEEVNLLRGARNGFLSLQRELEMIQSFLIDADAKQEAGDERLRTAVKQIREMAFEAEDLIDLFLQKESDRENVAKDNSKNFLKRIRSFFSCLVYTHQAGSDIEELKKRFEDVTKMLQGYQVKTDAEVIRKARPKSYPYSIGVDNVVGFDNDVEILVQQLVNKSKNNILAIVGMGGSGKSTLARKIYNHQEIGHNFDCQAWISVSQEWNNESLLKEILRQTTGRQTKTFTLEEAVGELHKLLHGKSYLVVLDDVWEQDALRQIMLPATSHGSKFLITTRIREVVRFPDLGCSVHEPRRLTPQESWELFKKIAFGHQSNNIMVHVDDDNDPYVVLSKEMLRKCDGLPLAVISLAGLLSTKETIHEWDKVKHNVSSKISEDVGPSDYGKVEDMLALSYSDLNHTLKYCFLYIGLFPEDAEIPTGMLMRSWIAEGFIKLLQPSANETIEDVARHCLNELIQRCVVQIATINHAGAAKAIRIHDLMRDLAIKRAKKQYFLDTFSPTFPATSQPSTSAETAKLQPRRLGVLSGETNIQEGQGSRLRSFVQFLNINPQAGSDDPRIGRMSLEPISTNYLLLRVLNLNGIMPDNGSLPDEIGNLIHLRYLGLKNTNILTLPESVGNLIHLLTLEYQITSVNRTAILGGYKGSLPNLKQMKQLRHLHLPGEHLYYKKALNLQDLSNLQVLWGISAGLWTINELKGLSPTIQKLGILAIQNTGQLEVVYQCPSVVQDRLHTLKLQWYNGELELQKLRHCEKLQKLILEGTIAKIMPFEFPPFLLKLVLVGTKLDDQDSLTTTVGKLAYLKVVWLHYSAYTGSHLTFAVNSFLQLEDLQLNELPNLVGFHVIEGAMPRLKRMEINNCKGLKALPQGLKTMTTLQRLEIRSPSAELHSRLRDAETEIGGGGEDWHIIRNIPAVVLYGY